MSHSTGGRSAAGSVQASARAVSSSTRKALAVSGLVFVGGFALLAVPSSRGTAATAAAKTVPNICPSVPPGQTLHYGQTMPVMLAQVPSPLPCTGAEVNHDVVLLPLASVSGMLTPDQAVATLEGVGYFHPGPGFAITSILLTDMTVISTLPPSTPAYYPGTHTPVQWNSIKDRQVWLITISASTPQDIGSAGKPEGPQGTPFLSTNEHMAIDARTGQFVIGFFTT